MNGIRKKVFGRNKISNTVVATALITLLLSPISVKAEDVHELESSEVETHLEVETDLTVQTHNSIPLALGNRSPEIKQMKDDLTTLGFTSWTNPSDYYGQETVQYVKEFQAYYGLSVSGEGDAATLDKLAEVLNSPYQLGNSSSDIQHVKVRLMELGFTTWSNPSGYYGSETVEFMKDFQAHHGLVAHGIVDNVTYEKLTQTQAVESTQLSQGARGPEVQKFKDDLMAAGFTTWSNPNDYFGAQTTEFVEKFQAYYGLDITGTANQATMQQLDAVLNSPYQLGNRSSEIQAIKVKLTELGFTTWSNPNDNFGRETVEFVKEFQLHHGLVPNGIVDSVTYNKLQESDVASDKVVDNSPDKSPTETPVETFDVQKFKVDLMNLGFTTWTNPNSSYGPQTIQFVKDFQKYYGLPVNGKADKATLAKIEAILNSPYQQGRRSAEIQKMKQDLSTLRIAPWTNPNNNYGAETVRYVKDFQRSFGLPVSGIADKVTLARLAKAVVDYKNRKPIVYLDPGHGGSDPGASHHGLQEKTLNLRTSQMIKEEIEARGYDVVMSRERDVFVGLSDRPIEANRIGADIFVSVHYNSMGGAGSARGIETFIYHRVASGFGQETNRNNFKTNDPRIRESLKLADAVHNEIIRKTKLYNRGVKGNNFNVIRNAKMPAILLELGFLDNRTEANLVKNSSYQRTAAIAVADGIDKYFSNR